jgi:hypothetical protein
MFDDLSPTAKYNLLIFGLLAALIGAVAWYGVESTKIAAAREAVFLEHGGVISRRTFSAQ